MDQIQNGVMPEFLQQLLVNPAAANQTHRQQLEALVQTYPACSIFRLLLAKSAQNADKDYTANKLQSAAVHVVNREILFRMIHQPELITIPKREAFYPFVPFSEETKTVKPDTSFNDEKLPEEIVFAENYPVTIINTAGTVEKLIDDVKPVDLAATNRAENPDAAITNASFINPKPAPNKINFAEELPFAETKNASFIDHSLEEVMAAENDLRVEDVSQTFVNEAEQELIFPADQTILVSEETIDQSEKSVAEMIDEEVYEEIMAIEDIDFKVIKTVSPQIKPLVTTVEKAEIQLEKPELKVAEPLLLTVQDKAEKDMLSNIASIDYFTFNNRFGHQNFSAEKKQIQDIDEINEVGFEINLTTSAQPEKNEQERVSKYHDDKMPYTFMWWLDKTRKEYAGTYRPYVKNAHQESQKLSVGPELNQQYIESIFHTKAPLKVPENVLLPVAEPFAKRKEDELIDRFIIQEPHIHPPSMDRLDTENKAKKSSEDADILVTETLAKVYLDQMLYHKALDTYKKLQLKFPEKSIYFADQIEQIEKKIN